MKKYFFYTFLIICLYSCDVNINSSTINDSSAAKWKYDTTVSRMTSRKMITASLETEDYMNFQTRRLQDRLLPELTVRHNEDGNNQVMLSVESPVPSASGIFYTKGDSVIVMVRFDEEQPLTFTGWLPDDGDSAFIFIHPSDIFINKLKTSKKTLIQAPFIRNEIATINPATKNTMQITTTGAKHESQIIEFNTQGFIWNY